jgi:4-amino-4-deoxy-L-arabinose transferase-like glycosyltransferase
LSALGTLLLVWVLALRMFGGQSGMAAGLVFATAPLVMWFARVVVFDMTLTFLVTLTLATFWFAQAAEEKRRAFEYLMFAAAGAATISKGPVGFLVPLLTLLVYAAVQSRFADLKAIAWARGVAIFLAISLPWFIAVSIRNPYFPKYAFWNESILRFTTARAHRGGSVFYYIPVFLLGFLPWSFTLTFAGLNRLKGWRRLRDRNHAAQAFLLSWATTVFVLFSLSHSKLPAYFLPAIPALAVLMGRIWSADIGAEPARPRADWLTAGYAVLIAMGLLLAAAPAWLQASSVHRLAVAKIHPRVLELLSGSMFSSGVILAALGVLGRNFAGRTRQRFYETKCFAVLALAMPLLGVRWWLPLRQYALVSSSKSLAEAIDRGPDHNIPVYGYYYYRTSLPFYLRRPVGLVTADGDEFTSNYIAVHWPALRQDQFPNMMAPDGAALPLALTGSEFTALGRSPPTPFLVMVRNDEVSDVEKLQGVIEPLWQAWKYSVWEVSAQGSSRSTEAHSTGTVPAGTPLAFPDVIYSQWLMGLF